MPRGASPRNMKHSNDDPDLAKKIGELADQEPSIPKVPAEVENRYGIYIAHRIPSRGQIKQARFEHPDAPFEVLSRTPFAIGYQCIAADGVNTGMFELTAYVWINTMFRDLPVEDRIKLDVGRRIPGKEGRIVQPGNVEKLIRVEAFKTLNDARSNSHMYAPNNGQKVEQKTVWF